MTERVLGRAPGPRALWIAAWAIVPWLNAGANLLLENDARSAVWEQSDVLVILNYAALSFAIVVTLWGTERIARRLQSLLATAPDVFRGDPRGAFQEMNSISGPLVASGAAALAFGLSALIQDGLVAALLRGGTWFVLGCAFFTFLWTYASLQLGLDRLGREPLRADAAPVDPGLGVQPFGALAFMGLWMLLVWLVPVLLTGLPDFVGVVLGLLVLAIALSTFFLSLFRLHRQMVVIKAREIEFARSLYAKAYEAVRTERTVDALEKQHHLLHAAEGLERRAREIHDWPIDEGIVARVITIATSVVGITVARLILDPIGL
jgi:hypothetical protein